MALEPTTLPSPATVGILIFEDVEVLDFCGPFEVFATASGIGPNGEGDHRHFNVLTIAEKPDVVTCRGGLLVQPHHTFGDHPHLDVILLPGGFGTRRERLNPAVIDWIKRQNERTALTTSVCTGAFLLGSAGLLDGLPATSHWQTLDDLHALYPEIDVRRDERIVDNGRIVTSAGVSAGIDMALYLVDRFHGLVTATATARDMEYAWNR